VNTPQQNPNLDQLISAAIKLEPLLDQIAFVGGCVTGLLVTDPGAAPVRATLDVDVIVGAASYANFTLLEEELRRLGFRECREKGAPICRWIHGDLILDFMPTDSSILGFSNRWYAVALATAQRVVAGNHEIRVITAPCFVATKLEALRGRGKQDFHTSHDLEDIVTVIDSRQPSRTGD
jgi:predicted nucleotidyltransferase